MDYRSVYEPRVLTWWDIEPYLPEDFQSFITIRDETPSVEKRQLFDAVRKLKGTLNG